MLCGDLRVIILCGFIFGNVVADPIDFSDCGSEFKITGVDIEGCKYIPCNLQIGNSYNITMSLKPSYTSHSLSQEVYVTLFNSIEVPLNVLPDNPCASLACPVQVSSETKFKATLYIGEDLVAAKGKLWWKMTTEYGRSAVCMKTSVAVQYKKYKFNFLKQPLMVPGM